MVAVVAAVAVVEAVATTTAVTTHAVGSEWDALQAKSVATDAFYV